MKQTFNIYCDESCHLENDHQKVMVLGAVWLPTEKVRQVAMRLREIKEQYQITKFREVKWTKVSKAKASFYQALIDYFFDDNDIHFRCLIVPDKAKLNHKKFNQTHDEWYYKMYFSLLKTILKTEDRYRIYIDIKDTRGGQKVRKLQDVLSNQKYDFDRKIIERTQIVRSHEVEVMQLADLLIGAMGYIHRKLETNEAKQLLIERIKLRSHYSLERSTLLKEDKFNIFIWEPSQDAELA